LEEGVIGLGEADEALAWVFDFHLTVTASAML
jgi:hypothetical protein